jgi:uncharacterized protein YfiM (DUF2279 family)
MREHNVTTLIFFVTVSALLLHQGCTTHVMYPASTPQQFASHAGDGQPGSQAPPNNQEAEAGSDTQDVAIGVEEEQTAHVGTIQVKDVDNINDTRLYVIAGVHAAAMAGVYAAHFTAWWDQQVNDYRFVFDWYDNYYLEMDKFGHFFANIQVTKGSATMWQWAGFKRRTALWLGFLTSTVFYTGVELNDGMYDDLGFSVPDLVADFLGAAYAVAQEYYRPLKHFNFKISYWPSDFYRNDDYKNYDGFKKYEAPTSVLDDYDGMTFWLSADVNWLLPDVIKPYWPDWLNIAIGYGAKNLPQSNQSRKKREFYIALDYNLNYLPGQCPILKAAKGVLNAIHLPAPTIRITSDEVDFLFLYF